MTVHLHRQNQVAHAVCTRDFWLASLSIHFPIHFARRAHEYPITLSLILVLTSKASVFRAARSNGFIPLQVVGKYSYNYSSRDVHVLSVVMGSCLGSMV